MGKARRVARDVFFWTFQRGTIPYDILCGLILAFIFFVPRTCFAPKAKSDPGPAHEQHEARNTVPQNGSQISRNVPQQGK